MNVEFVNKNIVMVAFGHSRFSLYNSVISWVLPSFFLLIPCIQGCALPRTSDTILLWKAQEQDNAFHDCHIVSNGFALQGRAYGLKPFDKVLQALYGADYCASSTIYFRNS